MTTWSFGGTALSTFGRVTVVHDYLDIGNRRGENILIPYRHGRIYVPKYWDERRITIGLGIIGTSASDLESKIDTLHALVSSLTQKTLSQTREDATVRTVLASVDTPMQVERFSAVIAKAVIEFTLPFPFFRLSTEVSTNETTINANPKAMTVNNPGTVEERDATIVLTGPLENTVITNSTTGYVLTYTGTIASPRVVTISIVNGEIVASDDLGANKISNITHSGGSALMVFEPGNNSLSVADDSHSTGKVRFRFYAPFL